MIMERRTENSKSISAKNKLITKVQKSSTNYKSKIKQIINENKKKNLKTLNKVHKKIKRKQYNDQALQQAVLAVKDGASYRKAGENLGVPSATLFRKMKYASLKARPGPSTVLTDAEENEIVGWIIYRAETGSPVTKDELLTSVQTYLNGLKEQRKKVFKDNLPGKKWYQSFRKRHPNISLRTPQTLPLCRASVTEEDLRSWFKEVESYLVKKNLKNIEASRVFNCDETNFAFCPKPTKVLVKKGAKSVYKVNASAEKENITTIFMYNAKGQRVKPMTLFKYQEAIPKKIVTNAPKEWSLGISDSGWMTTESFYEYMTNIFYPFLVEQEIQLPVLVYLDGHASHITVPLVTFCREKKIELISLYPHSTHITQPLDIALFHPLKDVYNKKAIPKWMNDNNTDRILKENFTCVLKLALDLFENEESAVVHGFERSGLYPFNPDAVEYDVLKKSKSKNIKNKTADCDPSSSASDEIITHTMTDSNCKIQISKIFLSEFEENLSRDLLELFQACESSRNWTGAVKYEGLFEYWLNLKQRTNYVTDANAFEQNTFNEQKEFTSDSLVLNLEPPSEFKDSPDLESKLSENIVDVNENQMSVGHEPLSSNQEHENNMSMLSDILSGNVHISTMKEPTIDEEISLPAEETVVYASECSAAEISNLLGQNVEFNELSIANIPIVRIPNENIGYDIPMTNTAISPDERVDNESILSIVGTAQECTNIENRPTKNNLLNELSTTTSFNTAFTLPTKYLPKKKRIKLEGNGKKKTPVVGTSDEWWQLQQEKEQKLKEREERLAKKRELQQKKKALAEQSKQLQLEINTITKVIKQEK